MDLAHGFSGSNMVLAHIVDADDEYAAFYKKSKKFTIMDNGAFELGKPYDIEKLIELGHKVGADCIVAPDYPGMDWKVTVNAFEKFADSVEGFKLMFVPQSEKDDIAGYLAAWEWAAKNPKVDLIGCSILGAPNADTSQDRLISRFRILRTMESFLPRKKVHMLGMLDSVHEIALCRQFEHLIFSWDSSAAVWAGLHGTYIKDIVHKFEKPVDFDHPLVHKELVRENMFYIQGLL